MHEFQTRRAIEFVDTDMGGIVHFSRFFIFMETAEHQFLNAVGTSVSTVHEGRKIGWPRVAASCQYKSPARFGETLDIRVRVKRKGTSSMTYEFTFERDGELLATGAMTSVCCVLDPSEKAVRPIPIPADVAERLEQIPD